MFTTGKNTVWVIIISNYVLTECNDASFIVGFIVLVLSRRDTASQHGKGRNISVTHFR